MAIAKDWVVFMISSCMFLGVCYFQPDVETFVQVAVRGFITLAALTFSYYIFAPWWQRVLSYRRSTDPGENSKGEESLSEEQLQSRQEAARQQTQTSYDLQAQDYEERITKPRQEAKKKKKEEDYYKFTGPAWKGHSDQLGDGTDDSSPRKRTPGSSQEAAMSRSLPEAEVKSLPAVQPKEKKKIELPEEPALGEASSVTVALRTPLGRNHRRRFLTSHTIQVLLDYMSTVGFSQHRYTIYQTYPRACISHDPHRTLVEAGLTHDVALNVEEND